MCSQSSSIDFLTARKDDSTVRQCAKKQNIKKNAFKIHGTKLHVEYNIQQKQTTLTRAVTFKAKQISC